MPRSHGAERPFVGNAVHYVPLDQATKGANFPPPPVAGQFGHRLAVDLSDVNDLKLGSRPLRCEALYAGFRLLRVSLTIDAEIYVKCVRIVPQPQEHVPQSQAILAPGDGH